VFCKPFFEGFSRGAHVVAAVGAAQNVHVCTRIHLFSPPRGHVTQFGPPPEEHRAAMRLEGWPLAPPRLLPSFETPCCARLLRMRAASVHSLRSSPRHDNLMDQIKWNPLVFRRYGGWHKKTAGTYRGSAGAINSAII
jgi:hypothetical protein